MPAHLEHPDYHDRRLKAVAALDAMPRGMRTRLAFDVELAPSLVSAILGGSRYTNNRHLVLIEQWIAEQRATAVA